MRVVAEANRKFLNTGTSRSAADWDSLLEHQVDLAFPQELEFLLALPVWREASRILDAGCGNGYYMSRLQHFFPEKEYCGVDISPELISRAASRYPTLAVSVDDIINYRPAKRFDIIIMRFLVQHLKDFRAILSAATRLLRPRGRLVVIESDLARSRNFPALPQFTDMLLTFARVSAEHGAIKPRLLADPYQLVADSDPCWSTEQDKCVTSPRIGPFGSSRLLTVYRLWVDLCERSSMFNFDFDAVRDELQLWAKGTVSFSTVALRMIVIKQLQ